MNKFIYLTAIVFIFSSCKKESIKANYKSQVQGNTATAVSSIQNLDISNDVIGVIELPTSVDSKIRSTFKWYTKVTAPNGKPIHLLAQNNWTKEKVAYTRTVLENYLTSDLTLIYGNKTEVANNIANSYGAMTMFNDANSVSSNNSGINGQDLQADETVAVGSPEYLDLSVRNAALEEILHFVHDLGLSITFPQFQKDLESATAYSIDNYFFVPWSGLPVADYDNELLAAFNDSYWGTTEHNAGLDKPYVFLSREASEVGDIQTTNLMRSLLSPYMQSTQLISSSFNGTFYLTKTSSLPYSNQSQYYKSIKLLGENNSNVEGNSLDNSFTGNKGNNSFNGLLGTDNVYFSGSFSEYTIVTSGAVTTVSDNIGNRDGEDKLTAIEVITFSDTIIHL